MRLLSGLPDRGYTLARTVGLLLVGFVFWLLASLGFLRNTSGSIVLAWLIVLLLALVIYCRLGAPIDLRGWWRENRRVVIVAELLFLILFVSWSLVRAHQNSLVGTEKPMELAFMSAVQRSETFPPNDPWMSGYSISYYYMGYVTSAMLSMMSAIPSTIGFNLTNALLFALTGLNAFGVTYNLVRSRAFRPGGIPDTTAKRLPSRIRLTPISTGLLAMMFVVLLGNFQTILIEAPYQSRSMPENYFQFWGTQERANFEPDFYTQENASYAISDPAGWSSWWWFRASRVLTDYQLDGELPPNWYAQPIDEFPQFSFLLADNHPHVLALPFAVLALGLALNILLVWRDPTRYEILFYGISLGGLVFLNTWDGPIYLFAVVGADALRRLMKNPNGRLFARDLWALVKLGAALLMIMFIAYLPFFISFRSQAAGVLPNLISPTQFRHYFLMFGPFLLILPCFLGVEIWRGKRLTRMSWSFAGKVTGSLLLILVSLLFAMILIGVLVPNLNGYVQNFLQQNGGLAQVIPGFLIRRVSYGLTTLLLLLAIWMIVARLFPKSILVRDADSNQPNRAYPAATGFALLLVGMGVMLSLVPEFFYLRDNFSTRINTIFKFYYQAWVVFSLASAYGIYTVLSDRHLIRPHRLVQIGLLLVLVAGLVGGLIYPLFGVYHRTMVESGRTRPLAPIDLFSIEADTTASYLPKSVGQAVHQGEAFTIYATDLGHDDPGLLQGTAFYDGIIHIENGQLLLVPVLTLDGGQSMVTADDYQAVTCLNNLVQGDEAVVVEAVRDAYNSHYGRVGALTGIPIVLGWENHERQWRGSTYGETAGTRREDIEELYTDLRPEIAQGIINKYDIDYIIYGNTERQQYGSGGEEKFIDTLEVVCSSGDTRIYRTSDATGVATVG